MTNVDFWKVMFSFSVTRFMSPPLLKLKFTPLLLCVVSGKECFSEIKPYKLNVRSRRSYHVSSWLYEVTIYCFDLLSLPISLSLPTNALAIVSLKPVLRESLLIAAKGPTPCALLPVPTCYISNLAGETATKPDLASSWLPIPATGFPLATG